MANNIVLTPKIFLRLALMDLGGALNVVKNMSTSVSEEFGKKDYKIGDTAQVRKPYRFVAGDGIGWDPQPVVDQVTPVKVSQVAHVHYMWDSVERTLDMREAMRLYTKPVAMAMGAKINSTGATFAANNALSSVGTPGTAPNSQATYLAAGDRLVELGLPNNEPLDLIINRRMSSAFVNGTVTYYNPVGTIGGQFEKGQIADNSLGYTIKRDQTINTHTNGTFSGSIVVSGANQTADGGNNATMSLTISGLTGTLKQGDRFVIGSSTSATVGGVNSVHPQTRLSTGVQQSFTLVQDSAANPTSIVVSPAITPANLSGPVGNNQYANVDGPAVDQAIITMVGTTGLTNIYQGLLMHENAFAFVNVPLWQPEKRGVLASESEQDPETKLAMSYLEYLDGDNRQSKTRFDSLYDFASLYKEMACVIQAGQL